LCEEGENMIKYQCQNCKIEFEITDDDLGFYSKIKVPPPTFCPECRNKRRMSYRNERSLHKTRCNAPGHTEYIVSMYDSKNNYYVYDNKYWWSDEWNPADYNYDYDFSKPFFSQFSKLFHKIPLVALSTMNSINSDYTNFVDGNKNCYLIFGCGWNENVNYGNKLFSCKDSLDLLMCTKCELSYECEGCTESSRLFYSRNSKNCINSYLLYNCRNCSNCFGCANLVNKSYYIWNKQYSKEDYINEIKKLNIMSFQNFQFLKEKFLKEIYLDVIHRYSNIFLSINCTGDNILNSKNIKNSFDIYQSIEDSKYQYGSLDLKDSYDTNGAFKNDLAYECIDCNIGNKNFSCITVYNGFNVSYSYNCHNIKNCFGCIGLRSKQYCILNKQYTKEQYEELVPKIIQHMNEMPYISPRKNPSTGSGQVYK
jgi:hypothetical protein